METTPSSSAGMELTPSSTGDSLTKPWECAICLRLLHQPATLPCGHSTCRSCLISCLEHARVCPECRAPIPLSLAVPACSTALHAALMRLFPAETAARAAEEAAAVAAAPAASDGGGIDELPLFVLDAMVPGQRLHLHVYEDRYLRLMRRALARPERHFGMVAPRGSGHAGLVVHGRGPLLEQRIAHVGSLVVIENVSDLGGGARLLVDIRATRRFRVLRFRQHADGYACAQAEWMRDAPSSAEDAHAALVLGRELRCALDAWVEQVRRRGREREPGQLQRLLAQLGAVPPPSEPEALGFWAAAVVNPLPPLGLAAEVRPSCLSCDESAQRLRLCLAAVEESMAHVCEKGALERLADAAATTATLLRSGSPLRLASYLLWAPVVFYFAGLSLQLLGWAEFGL